MAPKEGNSIVKHGVLDERLNVHGVKNLKVADLSIVSTHLLHEKAVTNQRLSAPIMLDATRTLLLSSLARSVLSWLARISATAARLLI